MTTQLDSKYLHTASSVLFTASGVEVQFHNGTVYNGPLENLKAHCMSMTNARISKTTLNGESAASYLCFKPSNPAQRTWLATKTGSPVKEGDVFTFGSRYMALEAHKEMASIGIKSHDYNWDYGVRQTNQAQLPL